MITSILINSGQPMGNGVEWGKLVVRASHLRCLVHPSDATTKKENQGKRNICLCRLGVWSEQGE
jgi:hypothetical protein